MTPLAVAADAAAAVQAARNGPGQIATLILPADSSWGPAEGPAPVSAPAPLHPVTTATVGTIAGILQSGKPTVILLGGAALRGKALEWAGRIAAKTGCHLMC